MSLKSDETYIYNLAIANVEATNKRLYGLYKESLRKAEGDLIAFRLKLLRGGVVKSFTEERLMKLISELKKEIATLNIKSTAIIRSGYTQNYMTTYYMQGYAWEKSINNDLVFKNDYFLSLPALDKKVINASFDKRIGGHVFKDRSLRVQRAMQYSIQDAVAQNIIEGQSVKKLSKNLSQLNDVYDKGLKQTERIARTELLKAYSIGQDTARVEAEDAGVEFEFIWSSRLDQKLRPDHAIADRQIALIVDGEPVFNVGGVQMNSPRLPVVETGSKQEAAQVINCRCRRLNLPSGIAPDTRLAKKKSGEWETINADIKAVDYIKREYNITI